MTLTRLRPCAALGLIVASIVVTACGGPEARKAEALEEGRRYLAAGNLDKARVEMRNALQIDPNDTEARYILGVIAERLGNVRQAAGHFSAALELDAGNVDARARFAKIHVIAGLPEQALSIVNEGMEGAVNKAPLYAVRGAALAQLGRVDEALADARAGVSEDPLHEQSIALLGGVLSNLEQFDEAAKVLEDGIAGIPGSVDLRIARAILAEQDGDAATAFAQYRDAIAIKPDDPAYRYQLAAYQQRSGDIGGAEKTLRDTMALDDSPEATLRLVGFIEREHGAAAAEKELRRLAENSVEAKLVLGDYLRRTGKPEQALAEYQALSTNHPGAPEVSAAKSRQAALLFEKGDRAAARDLLYAVLEDNPRSADALLVRASQAITENRPDDAIVDFRVLVRDDPEVIANHLGLARAYLMKGQTTLAEDSLRNAVKAEPNNLNSRIELAQFLARQGKPDAADDLIRSVIVREPDNMLARDTDVRIAITRKDWQAAFDRAAAMAEVDSESSDAYYLMGLSLEGLEDEPAAVASYSEALRLQADNADALAAYSRVMVRNGDVDAALAAIEAVPSESPNGIVIGNLHGEVLLAAGRVDAARKQLEATIARQPDWWLPYLTLAKSVNNKDAADRIDVLERGFAAANAPVGLGIPLAAELEREGKIDAAIDIYDKMIVANSTSDLLANNLAMLLATHRNDAASLSRARELTKQFSATQNAAFLNTFGWTRFKSGQLDVALPALRQAVELAPDSAILRYHLGAALIENGESDAARRELSRALEIGTSFPGVDDARALLARASSS